MSVVGYRAKNHPQQNMRGGPNPQVDERATTPEDFAPWERRFGFTLDVCALARNTKCERFYSPEEDGLTSTWEGERAWCNPPFSSIEPWVEKAWASKAQLVVMLLPANRTEQGWWQRHVEPYRDEDGPLSVEFLPGRMRFIASGSSEVGKNERPPFGCCLLIWEFA